MGLFADRVRLIDTENAFKVGPCIAEVEAAGHRVIRCNIGEPDFALPAHIRDEVKRQLDLGNSVRKMIHAREVAYVVAFLASPKSIAITGDVIAAGGGVGSNIYY